MTYTVLLWAHVFILAPTLRTVQQGAASRRSQALTLNVRDVAVLDVIECPLLQSVAQDLLGQAVCIIHNRGGGPWVYLHVPLGFTWGRQPV